MIYRIIVVAERVYDRRALEQRYKQLLDDYSRRIALGNAPDNCPPGWGCERKMFRARNVADVQNKTGWSVQLIICLNNFPESHKEELRLWAGNRQAELDFYVLDLNSAAV